MRWLFFCFSILYAADYDCAVAGTSPFSLFEALYQNQLGHRVLILEEAPECGGAWKSISVCGIPRADLGCHRIGNDPALIALLERYAGCKIIPLDSAGTEYYFSQGCYELITNLLRRIQAAGITLLTNAKIQTLISNDARTELTLQTSKGNFTTSKLIAAKHTCFNPNAPKSKYFHLYLLIQDPAPPAFSYISGICPGMSRAMNLTHFAGLAESGQQLLAIQTRKEADLTRESEFLDALKKKNLISNSAYILKSESYLYESQALNVQELTSLKEDHLLEILNTQSFQTMKDCIIKWNETLK